MFEKLKKIFKKEKKQMADLDKMLESLSDEEKKELKAKLQDLYKAEDERGNRCRHYLVSLVVYMGFWLFFHV